MNDETAPDPVPETEAEIAEAAFRERVFAYILSRGAAKISIPYHGGNDEGYPEDGKWLDKDDKELAIFSVGAMLGESDKRTEEPGEHAKPDWSKTYNHDLEREMQTWVEDLLTDKYGGFNDEPTVEGTMVIDAIEKTVEATGTETFSSSESFAIDF